MQNIRRNIFSSPTGDIDSKSFDFSAFSNDTNDLYIDIESLTTDAGAYGKVSGR